MTLSTGGFRQVVAFPPAPIATGWSDPCREGLAPSQEPCLSTAHDYIITMFGIDFATGAASQSSSSSDASRPASKKPPEITWPSLPSLPLSYGCGKCPQG